MPQPTSYSAAPVPRRAVLQAPTQSVAQVPVAPRRSTATQYRRAAARVGPEVRDPWAKRVRLDRAALLANWLSPPRRVRSEHPATLLQRAIVRFTRRPERSAFWHSRGRRGWTAIVGSRSAITLLLSTRRLDGSAGL